MTELAKSDGLDELRELVGWMDEHLDRDVADAYQRQPLAQDWARVAKVAEETGEAIDALIGLTGQNPRKGRYGSQDDLRSELCDVALTGLYALQHFTKNRHETIGLLLDRARYHRSRVEGALAPATADGWGPLTDGTVVHKDSYRLGVSAGYATAHATPAREA